MDAHTVMRKLFVSVVLPVLLGSTVVTPALAGFYLREEVRPIWVKVDTNRDGYVSRAELGAEDPGLLGRFNEADIDHDGKLSLGEFEVLLISL